jgi:hypothetical protein
MSTTTIQDTAQGLALTDNLIGRDVAGNKYYITVEIKPVQGESVDIFHQPVTSGPVITMSGAIVTKYGSREYDRGYISAGQNLDEFSNIVQFSNRWSARELSEILTIWREYHLNDMNSHCSHQDKAVQWDKVEPCPATGYRAGSGWLYAPVPDSVLIELTGLILKHMRDGKRPAYDYEVQGFYPGSGWETLTTEQTRGEALDRVKDYRANERGLTGLRIKPVKVQEIPGGWSL